MKNSGSKRLKGSLNSVSDGGLFYIHSDLLRMLKASPVTNQAVI